MSMLMTGLWLHALLWEAHWSARACLFIINTLCTVLLCALLCFAQITLLMLTFYYNTHLILYLSYCLALCCYTPANCSRKSRPDSGPEPSRFVVRISSAYSRSSNLIPFSPSGLRDPRDFKKQRSIPRIEGDAEGLM